MPLFSNYGSGDVFGQGGAGYSQPRPGAPRYQPPSSRWGGTRNPLGQMSGFGMPSRPIHQYSPNSGLGFRQPNQGQRQQNLPAGTYVPDILKDTAFIDGAPTFLLDIGIGGPRPGDAGYDYGNSMQPAFYGTLGGAFDPLSNLFPPQGPIGPQGPIMPPQPPNPFLVPRTDVNRTVFKPGSPLNPLVAAGAGGAVSLLTGGSGYAGAVGAGVGSLIGKNDTSQALWGGAIGGVGSFLLNGGTALFQSADSFDDPDERQSMIQNAFGKGLGDALGGFLALIG